MQIIPVFKLRGPRGRGRKNSALRRKFFEKGDFLHVDVADGIFTFHKTWNDPEGLGALRSPFPLEVHLMVEHPEAWIAPWLAAGAKRFIVPVEAIDQDSFREIAAQCKAGHARTHVILESRNAAGGSHAVSSRNLPFPGFVRESRPRGTEIPSARARKGEMAEVCASECYN